MDKEEAVKKLIEFWDKKNFHGDTFIHKEDYELIEKDLHINKEDIFISDCKNFSDYTKTYLDKLRNPQKEYEKEKYKFHSNLYPVPYCGDLKNAEIFILGLNPGFDCDYYDELDEDFKSSLKGNLSQQFTDKDYPLFYLDPKFCWTGGGRYWTPRFSNIIKLMINSEKVKSYTEALKFLSQNIALLEIVPYHSVKFNPNFRDFDKLPSVNVMSEFLNSVISDENNLLIVLRKGNELIKKGILHKKENVVIYEGGECQSASLSENSKGGDAIIKKLGLNS